MAYSIQQLSKERVRPIHGRNGALDNNNQVVGIRGVRLPITDLSTAAATIVNGGVYRITGLGSTQGPVQQNLPAPSPGSEIEIILGCTSTGSYQFLSTPNGASVIGASDGTTKGAVNFIGPSGAITLRAVSTASWAVTSRAGTSASWPTFTTST
jgi:hypothetical protein